MHMPECSKARRPQVLRRSVAAFHHVLLVRISQLLITQLQILLDPACEPAVQASVLRIVLRVTRTTLQQFHRQLGPKSGVLLEGLLSGAVPGCVARFFGVPCMGCVLGQHYQGHGAD